MSRLVERLTKNNLAIINTKRGTLKINKNRSPYVASAAHHFFKDEPETLEWIETLGAGGVFYDIGAATGIYSLYASLDASAQVLSFEPNALSFALLIENIETNKLKNIRAYCLALSNVNRATFLETINFAAGAGGNSLSQSNINLINKVENHFNQSILSYTLDKLVSDFSFPQPNYIKIDVDGVEPLVLQGAISTLKNADSVLIEIENEVLNLHKTSLIKLLNSLDFHCQDEINEKKRNYIFRKS